ncbi:hypothetical protein CFI11_09895 [Thalassococcus sp. S3]|nr:hypothetical protein CFI11_09895 [Thalassococcus sp. S3]
MLENDDGTIEVVVYSKEVLGTFTKLAHADLFYSALVSGDVAVTEEATQPEPPAAPPGTARALAAKGLLNDAAKRKVPIRGQGSEDEG